MRGRVADARQPLDPGQRPDQAGEIPGLAVRPGAPVGVDVLAEERELARAGGDQLPGLGQDRGGRARGLDAPGVGHDAERTKLVAALLHGQEGRHPGRGRALFGQPVELALEGKVGVEHRTLAARTPVQELGQPVIGLRPDHEVDVRGALEQRLALGLGDAAGDADHQIVTVRPPPQAQLLETAEFRIDLLGRLLADVAGVEDDQIGVIGPLGQRIAVCHQRVRHATGVVDIHLAAVGLDEQLLSHASAAAAGRVSLVQQVRQLVPAPRRMSL